MFISCTVVFFIILADEIGSNTPWMEGIDIAGLAAQFGSQFCAILSCFIFSKVAYAVSTICDDMGKKFARVNRRADDESWDMLLNELRNAHYIPDDNEIAQSRTPHLTTLKKIDQWYVKTVKSSLDPYGTWFAFHWVLYTLTAFLSISYFAEAIIEELYGFNHNKCFHGNNTMCKLNLVYEGLFMVEHCVLFLYPCFRAASVTMTRSTLIKHVSKAEWNNIHLDEKDSFITYLNSQDCSFKISIFCAKLPFGLNRHIYLFLLECLV